MSENTSATPQAEIVDRTTQSLYDAAAAALQVFLTDDVREGTGDLPEVQELALALRNWRHVHVIGN